MHRSNRVHLLLGILFVLVLALAWVWNQKEIVERYKTWASCLVLAYGCVAGFLVWMHSLRYSR
ncbi:MAG TPA: hypothetical protein VJQ51_10205, partial [Burkholderiales bacterium]|nr:hypothetical protein [Burkholderiales bacterium]